jgi:predicted nucleic acid-binding protein
LHKLSSATVSVDSSVVIDFHLTGRVALLEGLFAGHILISDLVEEELATSEMKVLGAEVVMLTQDAEWEFFGEVKRKKPGLGYGELGAITVAKFRRAHLLTNDRQARQTADEMGIPVSGAIGILEYAAETNKISSRDAVKLLEEMIRQGAWISQDLLNIFRQRMIEPEGEKT